MIKSDGAKQLSPVFINHKVYFPTVYIRQFSRIDTVTWPGRYLSVVRIRDGEGDGENVAEVSNTIRRDRDSIDGVLLIREDGDPEAVPGIHRFIKEIVPPSTPLILVTSGSDPASLDDLVGAGYVRRVAFRFTSPPGKEQLLSVDTVRDSGTPFCICCVLDPEGFTDDGVFETAERTRGHEEFILLAPRPPRQGFKKRETNALAKSLKGLARGIRLMDDVQNRSRSRSTTGLSSLLLLLM